MLKIFCISECNADLDRYRGVRDTKKRRRRDAGDDYIFDGDISKENAWPWAASLQITYKYRKNNRHVVKGQYY